jgi:hydrophobe/amphiphile efflux-3 (HAE3) family protein
MNFFNRLGVFVERRRLLILIASALLIIAAIFGAQRLSMATGIKTLLSGDSQVYKDYMAFSEHFGGQSVVVMVEGDDLAELLAPENLEAMKDVEERVGRNPDVVSAIGPSLFIEQAALQRTGASTLPDDPQVLLDIVTDPETGHIRPQFQEVFPDDRHALVSVIIRGDVAYGGESEVTEQVLEAVAEAGFSDVEVIVSGWPVISGEMRDMMRSGLSRTMLISALLMLAVLALLFNVRGFFARRWLALAMVVIAIIYAFGLMGGLGIPLTAVSMSVFAVLIGLGVDYGIQFHNRYDEERRKGRAAAQAAANSIASVGPAVGVALVVVCLSLASLFISPIPMIRDFGMMLLLGLVMCYLTALFLLVIILHWRDGRPQAELNPAVPEPERKPGWVEKGLRRLAPAVIRHPVIVLGLALALSIGGWVADSHVGIETDEKKFISQDSPVMEDYNRVLEVAGSLSITSIMVEAEDVTEPAILKWIWELEQHVVSEYADRVVGARTRSVAGLIRDENGGQLPQSEEMAKQILEEIPKTSKVNLVALDDYSAANLVIATRASNIEEFKEFYAQLEKDIADLPPGVRAALSGSPVVGIEVFDALTSGRANMTLLGIGLILGALVLLFRLNLLRALMAIVPISFVIGWSSGIMYITGIKFTPLTATLGVLILGIGAEYTILLMMRYREERARGEELAQAMTTAMATIGRAVIASGCTTMAGFGALLTASGFPLIQDFGIVTLFDVAFALLASLIVLPALVVWIDRWRQRQRAEKIALLLKPK